MNHPYQPQTIQPAKSDHERISDLFRKRITRRSGLSMVDFVETIEVPTSAGTKAGQKFSLDDSPYARRPLELMSPESICQLVVLMFPTQSTKSLVGQWVTSYYSKELPSDILYAMCDKESMEVTMDTRLTTMLQSVGVEYVTQSVIKNTRKTGDKTLFKQFAGGSLRGVTANSTGALSAATIRVLIGDELGKWKYKIGKEGSPWAQAWTRLKAWLEEKKALAISSPSEEETCLIWALFLTGTQEEWFVQCPLCGSPQILDIYDLTNKGLTYRTKNGNIIESSIEYICNDCSRAFKEKHKYEMQLSGFWLPKCGVEPVNKYTNSFHIHSLNSNYEMWLEIATAYEKGLEDQIAKQDYDNLTAGMPHRQSYKTIKSSEVIKNNRGEYKQGTVPDGVCYLVFGGDVQRGSDKWQEYTEEELQIEIDKVLAEDKKNDENTAWEMKFPRIEFEILGMGPAYRSWSIDYQVIYGKTDLPHSGAFEKLYEWGEALILKNGGFGYKREKDQMFFKVNLLFLDSGHATTAVYDFTQRWQFTFPCKGDREVTVSKKDAHLHNSNFLPWKKSRVHNGMVELYTLSTKFYTTQLYSRLKVKRSTDDIQWAAFQDFPKQYSAKYFDMLTVEEMTKDGGYDARGKPNEAGACRRYAFVAADVYLSEQVEIYRKQAKDGTLPDQRGRVYSEKQIEDTIRSRWVINYMAKLKKIDKRFLITRSNAA